ncbi:MAG: DMT family transporter, partial [Bacilli bacterium]|nr:DMT family transporter [Bacilli bacterium]
GNFEIFVTVIFAALLFKEKVSPRLILGIILVFLASMVLSFEDISSFKMSPGAIVVIIASLCWGFENNVTRRLSGLDTTLISTIKGTGTGITNLAIAFILGERITTWWMLPIAMAVGFVTYGLSFFFYLMAQRRLGASRTSAIFALAPFLGSFVSFFIFAFLPTKMYIVAVSLMGMGVYLASSKQESAK